MTGNHATHYSAQEIQWITTTVRTAAVALAEYWDVLQEMERTHQCEYDGTTEAIVQFASALFIPPTNPKSAITESTVRHLLQKMRSR